MSTWISNKYDKIYHRGLLVYSVSELLHPVFFHGVKLFVVVGGVQEWLWIHLWEQNITWNKITKQVNESWTRYFLCVPVPYWRFFFINYANTQTNQCILKKHRFLMRQRIISVTGILWRTWWMWFDIAIQWYIFSPKFIDWKLNECVDIMPVLILTN